MKIVEDVLSQEHATRPNKPIYLVGDSFGGCLALAVAARSRQLDLVLILVNPGQQTYLFTSLAYCYLNACLYKLFLNCQICFVFLFLATSFERSPLQPLLPILEMVPEELHFTVPYVLSFIMGT